MTDVVWRGRLLPFISFSEVRSQAILLPFHLLLPYLVPRITNAEETALNLQSG